MKKIFLPLLLLSSYCYSDEAVTTRFLRSDERFIQTLEAELPRVIEANEKKDLTFLQDYLKTNSEALLEATAKYGALLLRGFDIQSDRDFENTLLSINGLQGVSDAFMSEHGRERVDGLKYVLHTNTIYKTGGTLYLGGFHSENYYSADVPGFISFCCMKPSSLGGETGLINMEKVYEHLDEPLKKKLEDKPFFVEKWLVSDIAKRYEVDEKTVEEISTRFGLPVVGKGEDKLVLMYKPSVFQHPVTQKKALSINFFSVPALDPVLRHYFMEDYQGETWFWNRLVWSLPSSLFKAIENIFVFSGALIHSPTELFHMTLSSWKTERAFSKLNDNYPKVDSVFSDTDIDHLAHEMHNYYSSIIWQKGDILLVDNKKVAHAGMPGEGPRLVRALITNPIKMSYSSTQPGCLNCQDSLTQSIGYYLEEARKKSQ